MTSRPSSAALLLCSLLLTACEVPPPEQAEVAPARIRRPTPWPPPPNRNLSRPTRPPSGSPRASPTSRCGAIDIWGGPRGAGEEPTALRAMRRSVGSMETMVPWRSELTAVDFGNAPIDNLSVERSMPPIRRMVREIAETGAIPVIIGGNHSIEFANVAGLADVYGKENVGVIHFDAHYDAGDARHGHLILHAQPVRRLVDDGHTWWASTSTNSTRWSTPVHDRAQRQAGRGRVHDGDRAQESWGSETGTT